MKEKKKKVTEKERERESLFAIAGNFLICLVISDEQSQPVHPHPNIISFK